MELLIVIGEIFFLVVPVGSWICPSEACFTECAVSFIAVADSLTVVFDWVGTAAVVNEEAVIELEMPN